MTADLTHDRGAVCQGVLVNRIAHITEKSPGFYVLKADLNTFLRHIDELFPLRVDISDAEHAGRV